MSTILNKKEMKNAVVFLATGFEEIEALGTIDVLRRGGVRVMMVSITGDRLVIGGGFQLRRCLDLAGWNTRKQPLKCACPFERISQGENGGRRINRCYLCRTDGFRWSWIAKREKGYLFSFLRANNGRRYPYG